jgi:hypothetical protein
VLIRRLEVALEAGRIARFALEEAHGEMSRRQA